MDPANSSLQPNWPSPRKEVDEMKAYNAPLEGRRNLLRLDFNENTIGPSPLVVKALRNIPSSHISIYPEYNGLKEAIIKNLECSKEPCFVTQSQVGLFNGVDAAIHAICQAYGDKEETLLTTTPTFGYYEPCALMQGMKIITYPYESDQFNFPFQKIKAKLVEIRPKLLFICNPNNPTGTILSSNKILELASLSPNTLIVVDELYAAFLGDTLLSKIDFKTTSNIVVLRSLSKTAGLAGLRIGYALGYSEVVNRISRVTGPYDVNSFAVIAALAALSDQPYVDNYINEVLIARRWIKEQLVNAGSRHHLGGGNYLLIWPRRDVQEIENCLKSEGILVRSMTNKPLLTGSLRVSIGTKEQMQFFWKIFLKYEQRS